MGLKIKSFKEILVDMADWIANRSERLIDFSQGSVIRTLLEAVATELEEYYFKTYINMQYAMEHSLYEAFGFKLKEATSAYGNVTVTLNNPLKDDMELPIGTKFYATGKNRGEITYYETRSIYTIPSGTRSFILKVYALESGTKGNTLANTITRIANPFINFASVTNEEAITNGKDEETLEERRERFAKFIASRSKGTRDALEYGTMEVSGVAGCYVDESTVGVVKVFAHDGYGDLPLAMKNDIEDNLENYRCAGIPLFVIGASKKQVTLDVIVEVLPPFNVKSFRAEIESKLYDFFSYFKLGQDFMISDLIAYIRNIDGIAIKNCKIVDPTSDIEIKKNELVVCGKIKVKTVNFED